VTGPAPDGPLTGLPLPPYDLAELRADLHHLLQPIVGFMRLDERDAPDPSRASTIDRLLLALGLTDHAAGHPPLHGYDVRAGRTRHGAGFFAAETPEAREEILQAVADRRAAAAQPAEPDD
jgi:hypothetical protein